jgi:iron complex outermembrane receptor protein
MITAILCMFCLAGDATADSTRSRVEEIVVTAPKRERRALQPAIEIDRAQLSERMPVALTEIFNNVPSVDIRTNSRGEAVLRLRGSEERQTGIFLDGAPLSVPWDGRVDLSALPAGIVEEVQVTASAAPVEYGAGSVLGVVDLRTPAYRLEGMRSLQAEAGTQGAASLHAVGGTRSGNVDWMIGGGYRRIGGESVSSSGVIPFGPIRDGARSNTDLESTSLFLALGRELQGGAVRASWLSVGAERGIANAGHIDPGIGNPRYWRYPHWRFDQMTLNAAADIGANASVRSTLWLQHFEQTIDQYTDDSYAVRDSKEQGKDNTLGLRMVLERDFGSLGARVVGNAQVTRHDQVDTDYSNDIRGPLLSYQQNLFSIGAEVDTAAAGNVALSAALSYDVATTPKSGGKDSQDDLSDWAASVAARWYPSEVWQIAGTLGQRTRFPTLRELYGEALGQFLLNRDLQPEVALLGDITFERTARDGAFSMRMTPWVLRIDGTLSRRSVLIDGIRRRQRYNLEGSQGYGVEAGAVWNVDNHLETRLNASWQHLEAYVEEDGTRPVLYQRPEFRCSLVVDYVFAADWDLFLEILHTGPALDEDEDGAVVTLPSATELNLRLFKTFSESDNGRWRAYAGVDNLGNAVDLPQLGLPQPGRTVSLGVSFERL